MNIVGLTPMDDGDIRSDELRFSDSSETARQQFEDLYTTAQISRFLELTKGKRNLSLSSYFLDIAKFVKSAQHATENKQTEKKYSQCREDLDS